MIQNTLNESCSRMNVIFRFVERWTCKIAGSGVQNARIRFYETLHNSPSVMIWYTISKNEVIGLYFFENENVTGSTYTRMLRYFLFPKLKGYPENMIFQQNAAPTHYSLEVREYLNRKLPEWWISRGGPFRGLCALHTWHPETTFCGITLKRKCTVNLAKA